MLLVAVILLFTVPALRDGLSECYWILRNRPFGLRGPEIWITKAQVDEVIQEYPDDPQIWLGYAEAAVDSSGTADFRDLGLKGVGLMRTWDQEWSPKPAYERAIALAPESLVYQFRYAMYLLVNSGSARRKEAWIGGGGQSAREAWNTRMHEQSDSADELQRSQEQAANLRQAERMLRRVHALEPDNAACDYLLASILLSRRADEEALALLRAAIGKPRLGTYQRQAIEAVQRLIQPAVAPPNVAPIIIDAVSSRLDFNIHLRLRLLSHTLAGLGETYRERGRHEKAILCYEAAVHLGHVMRVGAYRVMDGLIAISVTHVAGGPFLSEKETKSIEQSTSDVDEELKLKQQSRVAGFGAYMRGHGRLDLAEFYAADMQAATQWKEQAVTTVRKDSALFQYALYQAQLPVWVAWVGTGAILGLWVIVAIISVAALHWREQRPAPAWATWQWVLLLSLCAAPGRIIAVVPTASRLRALAVMGGPSSISLSVLSVGLPILVWLVGVLILTLRKQARQACDQRLGKARAYLASLRALLPPTFAAFFLISVISLWPAHQSLERWGDQERAMIEQGDVRYWGISAHSQDTQHHQYRAR